MSQLNIHRSPSFSLDRSLTASVFSTTVDENGKLSVKIHPTQCSNFALVLGDQNLEDYEVTCQNTYSGLEVQFHKKPILQVGPLLFELSNDYFSKDFSCLSKHVQVQMQRYVEAGLGGNIDRLQGLLYQEACQFFTRYWGKREFQDYLSQQTKSSRYFDSKRHVLEFYDDLMHYAEERGSGFESLFKKVTKCFEEISKALEKPGSRFSISLDDLVVLPPSLRQLYEQRILSFYIEGYTRNVSLISYCPLRFFLNLTSLSLIALGLKELPKDIESLGELKSLSLRGNDIQLIPDWILTLCQLKDLDLQGNRITICAPLLALPNLKSLNLAANPDLSKFSSKLSGKGTLKRLVIESTKLMWPWSFLEREDDESFKNLRYLDVTKTDLSILSPQIGLSERLVELNLTGNAPISFPHEMMRLTALETLTVDEAQRLPNFIFSLPRLNTLGLFQDNLLKPLIDLRFDPFSFMQASLFDEEAEELGSDSVRPVEERPVPTETVKQTMKMYKRTAEQVWNSDRITLDLTGQSLTDFMGLEPELMRRKAPGTFIAKHNLLEVLPNFIFNDMPPKTIDLSYNQIARSEAKPYGHSYEIYTLDLSHNLITTQMAMALLENLRRLHRIDLSHNKIEGELEFDDFPSELYALDLSFNQIKRVNFKGMPSAKHLQELYLLGNPLETCPEGLTAFKKLEKFSINRIIDGKAYAWSKFLNAIFSQTVKVDYGEEPELMHKEMSMVVEEESVFISDDEDKNTDSDI